MGLRLGLGLGMAVALFACTTTTVDKSAQRQDPNEVWKQQLKRAERFHSKGFYPSAERHYNDAIETARAFGPRDRRMIETLAKRVELRLARGRYADAEEDFLEIVAIERRADASSPNVANALNDLAVFYSDLQRYWKRNLSLLS